MVDLELSLEYKLEILCLNIIINYTEFNNTGLYKPINISLENLVLKFHVYNILNVYEKYECLIDLNKLENHVVLIHLINIL